jgi:hypothetical protein
VSLLVPALLHVALAAPSLRSQNIHDLCPNPEGGIAYMLDGASLEWGSTSLTCDGEFSCSFSLASGAPHTLRTEGEVSIEVGCGGVTRLGLACAHGTCVPDSLTVADSGLDNRGYFPEWAPAASGASRDFLTVLRGAPEELLRHPEPVTAEIGMLAGRLQDTLRGCSELRCRLEDREVGWLAAADMAGRLSSQVIAVTGVDRARWGSHGWTAHYASPPPSLARGGPQIVGDLDCYDFSNGDALPAAACALTVRETADPNRVVTFTAQSLGDVDASAWLQEARVDGLVIGLGGGDGVRSWHRRPDTSEGGPE